MKLKLLFAATAGLALVIGSGTASALSLYTSPSINSIEDDNIDHLSFDANGNGQLDVGDRLEAILDYGKIIELTAAFSPTGNSFDPSQLTGYTEIVVLDTPFSGTNPTAKYIYEGSAAMQAAFGTGAMIALYAVPSIPSTDLNLAANCVNIPGPSVSPATTPTSCGDLATNGNYTTGLGLANPGLWAVFGIDPLDTDTEWFSTGSGNVGAASTLPPSTKVAEVNFALNVLFNQTGYDILRDKEVPCIIGFACPETGDGLVDVIGSADILGGLGLSPGYVRSDSDFIIDVKVPEPSSMALLGLGLLGMGAARRRKTA